MHESVLLKEVVEGLGVREGDVVVDGTVGVGGHAAALCERIGTQGCFVGIDEDEEALEEAKGRLSSYTLTKHFVKGNFRDLTDILSKLGVSQINVLLLDVGLRTEQLEHSGRGFSFRRDEPLLMTFQKNPPEGTLTAYEILNSWSKDELSEIFKEYGEEPYARTIAENIVASRKEKPLGTTGELVELLSQVIPPKAQRGGGHFATRTFQALRIATNDELGALASVLQQAPHLLKKEGRVAVISFHSLEDRIVKQDFKNKEEEGIYKIITKKPLVPSEEERLENSKSRSAKLRIAEKTI